MRYKKFILRWRIFIYFWLGCILFTYIHNKAYFSFMMSFSTPITVFNYNLISLHNDVFWFILIILALVYWSLYKILKDFGWNSFNKQKGFLKIFYRYSMLWDYFVDIAVCWLGFLKLWLNYYFKFIEFLINTFFHLKLKENFLLNSIKNFLLILNGKKYLLKIQ